MPTFADLTVEWLKTWGANKSTRYVATVKTRLDRDILPAIGDIKIDQLESSKMVKMSLESRMNARLKIWRAEHYKK